jgi:peptidyl-prolyl cis-trans isomerase A (cyclophilin A)
MWRSMAVAVLLSMPQVGAPAAPARSPVIVALETEKGRIEIAVDVAHAPVSAANFLRYVDAGAYNGGAFHRTVRPDTETRKDVPIEVIQARRSAGIAGWAPIALERTSVTGLKHLDGTVSMARSGPDSATSDFFICIGDQPLLDFGGARNADGQGFAAFGRVVAGMDVARAIWKSPAAPNSQNLLPLVAITRAGRKAD